MSRVRARTRRDRRRPRLDRRHARARARAVPGRARDRAGQPRHGRRQQHRHARGRRAATSSCSTRTPGSSATACSGSSSLPTRIPTRPSSGRGCSTPTGRCSAPRAASRPSGGSRPSTSSSASSLRAPNLLNPLYAGGFDHSTAREVDWLSGAALLVRRDATDAVGLFDESFFLFSEEVDWLTRFRRAGWKVFFCPDAEVVHVGGASHGGRHVRREPARPAPLLRQAPRGRGGRAAAPDAARRAAPARARAAATGVPRRRALPALRQRPVSDLRP